MRLCVAAVLILQLVVPAGARAAIGATLEGRVLPDKSGVAHAQTVWVGSRPAPVGPDGTFRADGLAAGPANVAIETPEGMYVVPTPITIAPGTTRSVQLAFGGRQNSSDGEPTNPPDDEKHKKKALGFWDNPLTATLTVIGAAVLVGVGVDRLTKSNNNPPLPSPSAPTD